MIPTLTVAVTVDDNSPAPFACRRMISGVYLQVFVDPNATHVGTVTVKILASPSPGSRNTKHATSA